MGLLAGSLGIPFVDQYETFMSYPASEGGWQDLLLEDGVHPNEVGFQVMAEAWLGGIVRLPFPPMFCRASRAVNRTVFTRRTGNLLVWRNSAKIDPSVILAYRIYRKDPGDPAFRGQSLALVPFRRSLGEFHFFDAAIDPTRSYQYVITAIRTDGIEGPCSDVSQDIIL